MRKKNENATIEMMNPPCGITHYTIPADSKTKVLAELACLNITEASVYCDLEHISKYYVDKSHNDVIENIINSEEEKEKRFVEEIFK